MFACREKHHLPALPDPVIERVGRLRVVRDDLIEGGTKRRVLNEILPQIAANEFVYAATPYGYGQWALAISAREIGKKVTIFYHHNEVPSALSLKAKENGANLIAVDNIISFQCVEDMAQKYADKSAKRHYLAAGLDDPLLTETLGRIISGFDIQAEEVWCAAGSGALSRSLQKAWPQAKHSIVRVRKQGSLYGTLCDPGKASIYEALEEFEEEAKCAPPFPSSPHYDAKLWDFVRTKAGHNALVWNM